MEKKRKATTIRLSDEDIKAILLIRLNYGLASDNQTIILAIHSTAKHLEQKGEQGLKPFFVSPKWVIKRYRLHEVAERLAGGEVVDWPGMVVELGYSDQAHFIKDFKTIVGSTPGEYALHIGVGS